MLIRRTLIIAGILVAALVAQEAGTRLRFGQLRLEFDPAMFSVVTNPVDGVTRIGYIGPMNLIPSVAVLAACKDSVCTLSNPSDLAVADLDIFRNGLLQAPGVDYTTDTTKTIITFITPIGPMDHVTARLFFC